MERIPVSRYCLFVGLAIAGGFLDLWSKHVVFHWSTLPWGNTYWIWTGHIGLQKSLNEGALFGMGQGMVWLFAAISIFAAVAIPIWLFRLGAAQDVWLTVALGCVMAGIIGNLYDRLGLSGESWPEFLPRAGEPAYAVRDWILLQWNGEWRWPNFNLADSFLVAGAGLLVIQTFRQPDSKPTSSADQAEATEHS